MGTVRHPVLTVTRVILMLCVIGSGGPASAEPPPPYGAEGSACVALPEWMPELRLGLVAANSQGRAGVETAILGEALGSYVGAEVVTGPPCPGLLDGADGLVIHANGSFADPGAVAALIETARAARLPVAWLGPGGEGFAAPLGLGFAAGPAPTDVASLHFGPVEVGARRLGFAPPLDPGALPRGTVLATIGAEAAPVAFVSGDLAYVGYTPLSATTGRLPFVAAVEAVARLFGDHPVDRRVILRLEDLSARRYPDGDAALAATTALLLERGVFMHLGIIPEDADQSLTAGPEVVLGDIGGSGDLAALAFGHPDRVELVQHGLRHWRPDPRNSCPDTGCAWEFFADDDAVLGAEAAAALARARLTAGREVMARTLWTPMVYEAPHYLMSPAGAAVAEALYPLILHAPWTFGGAAGDVQLPWFTHRGATTYGPSDVGYVAYDDPASVDRILDALDRLAGVMPDPVVTVFFHPFMAGVAGREGDLAALIDGIEARGYRFVSACESLGGTR